MSDSVLNYLATLPLFDGVSDSQIRELHQAMGLVTHNKPGHVVFDVGDKPDGAYIVARGNCTLSVPVGGGSPKELMHLGKGAVVGELCLVKPAPRTLRLTVAESTDLIVIYGPKFHRLRQAGHPGAWRLLRNVGLTLCERLRDTNELLDLEWRGAARAPTAVGAARKRRVGPLFNLKRLLGGRKGGE